MIRRLPVVPLTAAAFAPFGSVVEVSEHCRQLSINEGWTTRFDALSSLDVGEDGVPQISLFRSRPKPLPIRLELMERHPLGCQSFFPLSGRPYLVVVGQGEACDPATLCAFQAGPHQGVTYRRGIWHHYSLALDGESDFLVVDRAGPGDNLEEIRFNAPVELDL